MARFYRGFGMSFLHLPVEGRPAEQDHRRDLLHAQKHLPQGVVSFLACVICPPNSYGDEVAILWDSRRLSREKKIRLIWLIYATRQIGEPGQELGRHRPG